MEQWRYEFFGENGIEIVWEMSQSIMTGTIQGVGRIEWIESMIIFPAWKSNQIQLRDGNELEPNILDKEFWNNFWKDKVNKKNA